jgi:hypothetical protein
LHLAWVRREDDGQTRWRLNIVAEPAAWKGSGHPGDEEAGKEHDSERGREGISRLYLYGTEQRQGRQREEQHR